MNNSNAYRNANAPAVITSSNVNVKKEESVPEVIVVSGVSKKKKTFGTKVKELFVKEDAKSVSQYIFGDILIPAFTNTVLDMIKNGAEMMFLGRTRGPSRSRYEYGGRIRYENYYDRDEAYYGRSGPRYSSPAVTPTYSYDDITFESRADAEAVLMRLKERIFENGAVSVAFLYHLVGWKADYTADGYGWRDLSNANILMSGGGYWLRLPKPVVI